MENFILSNHHLNNLNGTSQLPLLVDIIEGKRGIGMSICTKIKDANFFVRKKRQNKNGSITLRCRNHRNCRWTGKIFHTSNSTPDSPEYLKTEHWIVTSNLQAVAHSCQGTTKNEIAQKQMSQFTKEKFHEGIRI